MWSGSELTWEGRSTKKNKGWISNGNPSLVGMMNQKLLHVVMYANSLVAPSVPPTSVRIFFFW